MKTTLRRLIILKYLSMKYGFHYRLKHLTFYGEWCPVTNTILIDPYDCNTDDSFVSTLLHEIGHLMASREGKYSFYHNHGFYKTMPTWALKRYIRTSLKAERYVDRWAEKLCAKDFPSIAFQTGYRGEDEAEYHRNNHLKPFIEELSRRQAKTKQRCVRKDLRG